MMREEMLKRLDEFVAEYADAEWDTWQALRAELAAERCENCAHWGTVTNECRGVAAQDAKFGVVWWTDGNLDEGGGAQLETSPDFCCSHFEKRPTP
ncbi:MAG: hypothetical protein WC683_20745 [bacterium]